CHQPKKQRGGLDLTSRDTLLAGGDNGPAIVPGAAEKSRVLRLVRHAEKPAMPEGGKKLSDAEIALLARWIDAGSPYERSLQKAAEAASIWWSLNPVSKPAVPSVKADVAW